MLEAYQVAARAPLLTPEQERELGLKAREGCAKAQKRLVERNLRLVLKIAHSHARNRQQLEDLVAVGNEGLCRAAQSFDPDKGRFTTHATQWIRGLILNYLLTTATVVKVGTTSGKKYHWQGAKVRAQLEARGIEVTPERIAKVLGIDAGEVAALQAMGSFDASLNHTVQGEDHSSCTTFQDTIPSPDPDPETLTLDRAEREALRERIHAFRRTLTPKQQIVLDARLLKPDPLTLEETGKLLGGSCREAVRQIEAAIKRKLEDQLADLAA